MAGTPPLACDWTFQYLNLSVRRFDFRPQDRTESYRNHPGRVSYSCQLGRIPIRPLAGVYHCYNGVSGISTRCHHRPIWLRYAPTPPNTCGRFGQSYCPRNRFRVPETRYYLFCVRNRNHIISGYVRAADERPPRGALRLSCPERRRVTGRCVLCNIGGPSGGRCYIRRYRPLRPSNLSSSSVAPSVSGPLATVSRRRRGPQGTRSACPNRARLRNRCATVADLRAPRRRQFTEKTVLGANNTADRHFPSDSCPPRGVPEATARRRGW